MGDEDTKLYTKCEIKKGFLGTPWFSHGLDCTEATPSDLPTYTNQLEVSKGTNVNGNCEVKGSDPDNGFVLHCDSTQNVSVQGKAHSQISVVSQGNSTDVYCTTHRTKQTMAWNANPTKGGFDCSEISPPPP